jgi:hypothetical protein
MTKRPSPPQKKKIKFKTVFKCMFCDFPVSCFIQVELLGVIFYKNFIYPTILFSSKERLNILNEKNLVTYTKAQSLKLENVKCDYYYTFVRQGTKTTFYLVFPLTASHLPGRPETLYPNLQYCCSLHKFASINLGELDGLSLGPDWRIFWRIYPRACPPPSCTLLLHLSWLTGVRIRFRGLYFLW